MKRVTVQIGDEEFEFIKRLAKQDGYNGPADCLNGLLNWALAHWMNPDENPTREDLIQTVEDQQARLAVEHWKIYALQELLCGALSHNAICEDVQLRVPPYDGGKRFELRPARSGDLDDEKPF